jgi:hypothetical protein
MLEQNSSSVELIQLSAGRQNICLKNTVKSTKPAKVMPIQLEGYDLNALLLLGSGAAASTKYSSINSSSSRSIIFNYAERLPL